MRLCAFILTFLCSPLFASHQPVWLLMESDGTVIGAYEYYADCEQAREKQGRGECVHDAPKEKEEGVIV